MKTYLVIPESNWTFGPTHLPPYTSSAAINPDHIESPDSAWTEVQADNPYDALVQLAREEAELGFDNNYTTHAPLYIKEKGQLDHEAIEFHLSVTVLKIDYEIRLAKEDYNDPGARRWSFSFVGA